MYKTAFRLCRAGIIVWRHIDSDSSQMARILAQITLYRRLRSLRYIVTCTRIRSSERENSFSVSPRSANRSVAKTCTGT